EQLWNSYVSTGATSIAPYLIHVTPQLQVDGQTVVEGPSQALGGANIWTASLQHPIASFSGVETFNVVSGDEIVFGIDGNGVTESMVRARFAKYGGNSLRENLQQASLHYWMQFDQIDSILGRKMGIVTQRQVSIGAFSAPLRVTNVFGVATSGAYASW